MKTARKILSVIIAILMLTVVAPSSVLAQDGGSEAFFTYEVNNGEATITGYNMGVENPYLSDNIFQIPDYIDSYTVTAIGENAFMYMELSPYCRVIIPNSVKRIEARAFYGCKGATNIHITDGVIWIGDSAFADSEFIRYDFGFTAGENQLYTGSDIFGSERFSRYFCCLNNYSAWSNYYHPGADSEIPLSELVFSDLYNYSIIYDYQVIIGTGNEEISLLRSYDFSTNEIPETIDGLPVVALGIPYVGMYQFYGNVGIKDTSLSTELIIPKSIKYIYNSVFPDGLMSPFKDISYRGPEEEWNAIEKDLEGNGGLSKIRVHYNYDGHAHKFTSASDPSTCIEGGASYKLCSVCNEKYEYTALPKSAHTYGDWTVTVQPTTQTEGKKERTCTVCQNKETANVPKIEKTYEYKSGDIIEFGSYPQTKVEDESILAELNALKLDWKTKNYYTDNDSSALAQSMSYADIDLNGDGKYDYRAIRINNDLSFCYQENSYYGTIQEKNGYNRNEIYYFKYEPLQWRVLDADEGYLMCNNTIDSLPFQSVVYEKDGESFNSKDYTSYANDWETSSIRKWLNNDFYNDAFSDAEKEIIKTSKLTNKNNDGLPSGPDLDNSKYDGSDTEDKIYLPSASDVNNYMGNYSANKRLKGTDYSQSQGCHTSRDEINPDMNYYGYSSWMLRTAILSNYISIVTIDGAVDESIITHSWKCGTVPALKIDGLKNHEFKFHTHVYKSFLFSPYDITSACYYDECVWCGEKEFNYNHTYGDWTVTVQPTTQTEGKKERTCSVCNKTQTMSIAKLDAEALKPTVNENAPLLIDSEKAQIYGFDLTKGIDETVAQTFGLKEGTHLAYSNADKPRTGDKIEIRTDGSDEVIASYTVVVFGDADGDGSYDGRDATIVSMIANGMLTPDAAVLAAADCNHDGVVDQLDVDILNYAGVLLSKVDQTKTQEELQTDSVYVEYINLISQDPDKPGGEIKPDEEPNDKPVKEDNIIVKFFKIVWNFIKSLFGIK